MRVFIRTKHIVEAYDLQPHLLTGLDAFRDLKERNYYFSIDVDYKW